MSGAFDRVAATYDIEFSGTQLGRRLREIVWSRLETCFMPGSRVLELNCGTGEDALWLARRGMNVLATDRSPAMLAATERKAAEAGLQHLVQTRVLDLEDTRLALDGPPFDGALSDFGGLNCVPDLVPVFSLLRRSVRPGGSVVLVLLGRWCLWEILWHLLHLEPDEAFRRLQTTGATARVGGEEIRVWYPTLRELESAWGQGLRLRRLTALGVILPPTYLRDATWLPRMYPVLDRLESGLAGLFPFRHLGDHAIIELERCGGTEQAAERVATGRDYGKKLADAAGTL